MDNLLPSTELSPGLAGLAILIVDFSDSMNEKGYYSIIYWGCCQSSYSIWNQILAFLKINRIMYLHNP